MRSRISFFEPGVARKALTRYWPIWATLLLCGLLISTSFVVQYRADAPRFIADASEELVCDLTGRAAAVVMAIFACFTAMGVWSYLFNPRAALFFHSLPCRRESLFFSHYASGLVILGAPVCATTLLLWVSELMLGYTGGGPALLRFLGSTLLLAFFFFSLATLCAFLTGHAVAMPMLYGLLNFAVCLIEYLLLEMTSYFLPGVDSTDPRLTALSPLIRLMDYSCNKASAPVDPGYEGWGYLAALSAAAVVLTVCALLLYRRRHLETAGDVIAVPALRPVFRVLFSFGTAVVLGALFFVLLNTSRSRIVYVLSLTAAGAIGYLVAEMLLQKRFNVFRGCLKRLCLLSAIWMAFGICSTLDPLHIAGYVPPASQILRVRIDDAGEFDDPADLEAVRTLHRAAYLEYLPMWKDGRTMFNDNGDYYCVSFGYRLRDGSFIRRSYWINVSAEQAADPTTAGGMASALLNRPELVLERVMPERDAQVTAIGLDGIYEIRDGSTKFSAQGKITDPVMIATLMNALRSDAEAGRAGHWPRSSDWRDGCRSFTFLYYLPGDFSGDELASPGTEPEYSRSCTIWVREDTSFWELAARYLGIAEEESVAP